MSRTKNRMKNRTDRTRLLAALVVGGLLLVAGGREVLAGHYALSDVHELGDSKLRAKIEAQGIHTTKQLLDATKAKKDRRKLAKKTGQSMKIVTWWANFTDLLRIDGVGPRMAKLIQLAGVANVAELRKEDPAALLAKVTAANTKYRVTELLPAEEHLKGWIGHAKKLPIIVE